MRQRHESGAPLYWQSQLLLLIVVPVCCVWIFLEGSTAWSARDPVFPEACGLSIAFGLVVWLTRAATGYAAATGAVIAACLYLRTPGWSTALFPLIAMLILALTATRIGRARKEQLNTAEDRRGRTASQVAANLGVAALAAIPVFAPSARSRDVTLAAIAAALAEAAADTLSSELGQVLGGQPRLLTTLKPVPIGTDGGITPAGTAMGCIGAAIVAAVSAMTFPLDLKTSATVFFCAVAGLFIDSLLGATFERRGWLNNDAVNFLSTLAAALATGRLVQM